MDLFRQGGSIWASLGAERSGRQLEPTLMPPARDRPIIRRGSEGLRGHLSLTFGKVKGWTSHISAAPLSSSHTWTPKPTRAGRDAQLAWRAVVHPGHAFMVDLRST